MCLQFNSLPLKLIAKIVKVSYLLVVSGIVDMVRAFGIE